MNVLNRPSTVCRRVCSLNNFAIRHEEGLLVFCSKDHGSAAHSLEETITVSITHCFTLVTAFVVVLFHYLVPTLNTIFNSHWRWYLHRSAETCLLNLRESWFSLKVWMHYCKFLIKRHWAVWVIVDIFRSVLT